MKKIRICLGVFFILIAGAALAEDAHCPAVLQATSQQRNTMLDNATRMGVELQFAQKEIADLKKQVDELTQKLNQAPSGGK